MNNKDLELFEQISALESQDLHSKAHALREEALIRAETVRESIALEICEKLAREKITIRGEEAAARIERFYRRLHFFSETLAGPSQPLTALAARKLASVLVIQGNLVEAIDLVRVALETFEGNLPKYGFEACEAIHSVSQWSGCIAPEKRMLFEQEVWLKHPLCEHLKPVLDLLIKHEVRILHREISAGNELGLSLALYVDAWLDLAAIRTKLALNECVRDYEYRDREDGGRGFNCTRHLHLIEGDFELVKSKPVIHG